jgi:hypothetical protein
MPQREKWALAFDAGGLRYDVMTTNSSESFNKVFKGIHAVPMSGIMEYSFNKCNEYFVKRWNVAKASKEKWGRVGTKHLELSKTIACNQVGEAYGPSRLVYNIRSAEGTNLGVRSTVVGIIGWTLTKSNALVTFHGSSMCLAPMSLLLVDAGV